RNGRSHREIAVRRPVAGDSLPLRRWSNGKLRVEGRESQSRERSGLLIVSGGGLQCLIRGDTLRFQLVQVFILKNLPPFAFGRGVFGCHGAPRLRSGPLRRCGGTGALVVRTDRAAGEKDCKSGGKSDPRWLHFVAPGAATGWDAGLTRTK